MAKTTNTSLALTPPRLVKLLIEPASMLIAQNSGAYQFTASGLDQYGNPFTLPSTPTWSRTGVGSIGPTGLYTPGSTVGTATVRAAIGSVLATASVGVAPLVVPPPEPRDPEPGVACKPCGRASCGNPFSRVLVSYLTRGGSTVHWDLRSDFDDPMPYMFQLQYGPVASFDGDWTDVGIPVFNAFVAVDPAQRSFGASREQFYRVKLVTVRGTYYSEPTGEAGTLTRRWWLAAKNVLRENLRNLRLTHRGSEGYLLKRRTTGRQCTRCLDALTGEIKDPACPVCQGTGFVCGYYFPISCVWASFDPSGSDRKVDAMRGSIDDQVANATMVNTWLLARGDVWVDAGSDDRYYVGRVQNTVEMQTVPLVARAVLSLAPASDPVYAIEIPRQLPSL